MILQGESYEFGTVFQTVAFFLFVIPRLRPGLLSLRSVLSSRQIILTQLSQATNMLLISNKISINKNKQIYFFCYFFIFLY